MSYTLLIGNKNYSSWSLRPWLLLHAFGVPFTEERHVFDTPEFAAEIQSRKRSPNGKVPVLVDADIKVWDSLAISEYLAERHAGMSHRCCSAGSRTLRLRRNALWFSGDAQLDANECSS